MNHWAHDARHRQPKMSWDNVLVQPSPLSMEKWELFICIYHITYKEIWLTKVSRLLLSVRISSNTRNFLREFSGRSIPRAVFISSWSTTVTELVGAPSSLRRIRASAEKHLIWRWFDRILNAFMGSVKTAKQKEKQLVFPGRRKYCVKEVLY